MLRFSMFKVHPKELESSVVLYFEAVENFEELLTFASGRIARSSGGGR